MSTPFRPLLRCGFSSALTAACISLAVGLVPCGLAAQGTSALTLDLATGSFKSPDLPTTPMRVTAAESGDVTVRLYDQVLDSRGRVLLQEHTVAHPGGGASVAIPFAEAYRGRAIYAEAEQAGTDATDAAAFVSDLRAFTHPRTEPDDFDAWWAEQKADLAAVAPDWTETRLPDEDTDYSTAYRVTGSIGNGRHVTMWVAIPKAGPGSPAEPTSEAKLPAMIVFPAAGNTHDRYFQTPATAAERVGAISVSVNLHEDVVTGSDGTGKGGSYVVKGVSDRETNYFLDGIKRCLRAVDYVREHPRFDGGDIMAFGESQGGGLAKTVAGLYPGDIDLVMSQHDALSTHGARPDAPEGWPRWVSTFAADFEEVAYFDATFHARRIRARKMFSNTGFADVIVAPAAALTSFNQVDVPGATKVVLLSEDRGHTSAPAYARGYLDFALANLRGAIPPKATRAEVYYEDREIAIARAGDTLTATYVKAGVAQELSGARGRWVTVAGPGAVTFSDPTAAVTTFEFAADTIGEYVVAFEVEEVASYGEVYVTSAAHGMSVRTFLPPQLTAFTAKARPCDVAPGLPDAECAVDLAWTSLRERDAATFDVERSGDGANWTVIGAVPGRGASSQAIDYVFADADPMYGDNHYRIRQRDADGAERFTEVVVVSFEASSGLGHPEAALAEARVYPNPCRDYVTVAGLPRAAMSALELTLVDLSGRVVATPSSGVGDAAAGDLVVVDLRGVSPGVYVLRIHGERATAARRVVVR